jgi:Fe-S-cluster containining protein
MKRPFYSQGLRFSCTQCSYCCRNEPGYVFLSEKDLSALLIKTSMTKEEFIESYCKIADFGFEKKISIREKPNNDCIFWEDGGCQVYEARPLQCRSYPFWSMIIESKTAWENEKRFCPGLDQGQLHSRKEIEEWLKKRLEESLISL